MNSDDFRDDDALSAARDLKAPRPIRETHLWLRFALLLAIGFALIALTPFSAHSEPRFEALGGQCRYGKVGNFIWYNDQYQHSLDMASACGMFAVSTITGSIGYTHVGWRIAYVNMGTANVDAIFPMRDDDQAAGIKLDGSKCNADWHGCLGHGVGAQTARGISTGLLAERDVWGMRVGAELGLFVYEGRWRITITPEAPSQFQGFAVDWRGYQATPFIGASLRYGYLMGMVRGYSRIRAAEHGCGGCSGVAGKSATQALIGISIPL